MSGRVNAQIRFGAGILAAFALAALVAPWLGSPWPDRPLGVADVFAPPAPGRWLGTDDAGGDVLLQLLAGARVSMIVGLFASLISVGVGGAVGLVAGFAGGRVETWLMRLTDVVLVLPALPLAIVLVALTTPGLASLILVIGLVGWTGTARLVRAQTLSVKERAFVRRARALGAGETRILLTHVLPHVVPLLAANGALVVSQAILSESTLSFLGLGDPDLSSWGGMLSFALSRGALSAGAWWALVAPGAAILLVVLGASLLGFGLEERWMPRARRNHLAAGAPAAAAPAPTAPAASDAVLVVRDLAIDYAPHAQGGAPVAAVRGVDLELAPGEIVGLVGESGCGKTTVLMSLLGLLPAGARVAGGSIRLAGRELVGLDEAALGEVRRRDISLVYQGAMNALNPVRTVGVQIGEKVLLHAPESTRPFVELRVRELLERVGIPADRGARYPHELSGGMRQRAVIAMALAATPRVLCADEPTTALDVVVQAQILALLDELRRELGLAVLLVTHDLGVVAEICDRVVVMYGGTVAEAADAEELFHRPRHPYTRELLRAFPDLDRPEAELVAIPGTPPRLDPPPAGCRFAPRCPAAVDRCRVELPAVRALAPRHRAACHLAEPG
jgi:oligopeptide/dipeptide ABC transporter ATP-binding protein